MKLFYIAFTLCLSLLLNAAMPTICLPREPSATEKTAADELAFYLQKITGSLPEIVAEGNDGGKNVIYVGSTDFAKRRPDLDVSKLSPEEWAVYSHGDNLIIAGGQPRGIIYAVYHYLEDCLGVRFWNHREETVPKRSDIPLRGIACRGEPEFLFREICSLHVKDSGRFAAKMRLTSTRGAYFGQLDPNDNRDFGMESIFGPPNFVHTFSFYIPYNKYYKEHPEFFGLENGKRTGADTAPTNNAQAGTLCLSNPQLRQELLKNLKNYIRQGRAEAQKHNVPLPRLYDVSGNDNQKRCECERCKELIDKYKNTSGLYLDMINELADGVRDEFPEVILHTYSYITTTAPPECIKARPNVCVTLCDHDGNLYDAYTQEDNAFMKRLEGWRAAVQNLRVWIYGLTFAPPRGLPFPNEFNYAEYMKVFRCNGVSYLMEQLESPILSDCFEYKLWLWAKLAENPDLDTMTLIREFANGFYGKAAPYFIKYRVLLHEQAEKKRIYIPTYATPGAFVHLDYDTMVAADNLFAEGEKALAGDAAMLRRWHAARLSLDRAIIARARIVMSEYYLRNDKSLKGYAFDNTSVVRRIDNIFKEQLSWRQANGMVMLLGDEKRFGEERKSYGQTISERSLMPPEKFAHLAPGSYFDYPAEVAFRPGNKAVLREDPEAETGYGVFWNVKSSETMQNKDNRIFRWGMYSPAERRSWNIATLPWTQIGWDGYKWLRLGEFKLTPDCYMFFFVNWYIQMVVGNACDPANPDGEYEVWAKVRLVGKDENNRPIEVGIDRIVLIPPKK